MGAKYLKRNALRYFALVGFMAFSSLPNETSVVFANQMKTSD